MRLNFQNIMLMLISIFLLFVVFLVVFLNVFKKQAPQKTQAQLGNSVNYNLKDQQKLLTIIKNRPVLSKKDADIKKKIIGSLNKDYGAMLMTSTVNLTYDYKRDVFLVEILSLHSGVALTESADLSQIKIPPSNVNTAKNEAINWLIEQGISKDGICKLPVIFYLNPDIVAEFNKTHKDFSPLSPGC